MKIVNIETAWVSIKCEVPQGLSMGPITRSTDALCRITTDDGIQGIGEARGAALNEICSVIHEVFTPLLTGENPLCTQYLWDKMHDVAFGPESNLSTKVTPRAIMSAMAAVDLALWDIKAKAAGVSICELLGGKPRPIIAYLSKGFYVEGQTLSEMADEAVAEVSDGGYKYMKMRVGRKGPDEARGRVATMRKAFGDEMKIAVDVNQAWDLATAIEGAKAMEPYDLFWLEEPLPRFPKGPDAANPNYNWDVALGELSKHTSIPLSSGENHVSLAECNSLITNGNLKYMQFDLTKNGGLTEYMKVAAVCQANGVLMAPHHVPHFHIQVAAAVSNGFIVECYDNKRQHPAWPDLFIGFPEVKGGYMQFPKGNGWGMEINDEMVKKHGVIVKWDFK